MEPNNNVNNTSNTTVPGLTVVENRNGQSTLSPQNQQANAASQSNSTGPNNSKMSAGGSVESSPESWNAVEIAAGIILFGIAFTTFWHFRNRAYLVSKKQNEQDLRLLKIEKEHQEIKSVFSDMMKAA